MDKSMGKLAFKDILEPMRMTGTHKNTLKTCLSLTSFSLTVVGDLRRSGYLSPCHMHIGPRQRDDEEEIWLEVKEL